ncbi:MAG: DEAD/DEAH box helicase [Solirubrobacterales bacterium]|jgi:ATP-dependent RNA helicase RhlE
MSNKSFAELGLSSPVVDALEERGFTSPFTVQQLVIGDVLAGRDVLVQSPTGSGKTLAFGAPLVDLVETGARGPSVLVLAPTRELASQIVDEMESLCRARGLSIAAVYGGVGIQAQSKRAGRADILVACPGRLEDLIQRGAVSIDSIRHLVLDEADRMLDMGFKPAVDRIVGQTPDDRQTLFFSATLEGAAGKAARAYTDDPVTHRNDSEAASNRGRLRCEFVHTGDAPKVDVLLENLDTPGRGRTLVFVRTKHGADRLVKKLSRNSWIKAAAIHGNKSQNQRRRALDDFESGRVDTLVATDVAARGIDVADVTHVINFDMPEDSDTFVHRVGRTARAGNEGLGISFVAPGQEAEMAKMARTLGLATEFRAAGMPDGAPDRSGSRQERRGSGHGSGRRRRAGSRGRKGGRNR